MDDLALLIYKKNNKLERVDIANNKVTFLGANFLFRALTNDKVVKRVNLSSNDITGGELEDLRNCLKANTSLKYLNLSDCQLNETIGELIGSALGENSVLRTFILSANSLMDRGASAIAKALEKNEALRELDLSKNHITDQSVDSFVEGIIKNKELEILNLTENELTDTAGQKLLSAVTKNSTLRKLKLTMNSIGQKYIIEIDSYLKKNIIAAEAKKRKMVIEQFAILKERMSHYGEVKKESEHLVQEKKRLKKEIMKGVDLLHEANENKDKDLDCLRDELELLYEYERKLDTEIIDVVADMQAKERKKRREYERHKDKVDSKIASTMEIQSKVEELKEQFKDAEFQHRIEVGEITEALMNFKEKEKMWEGFVRDNEKTLKGLRIELNIKIEEPEEIKEVIKKHRHKSKKKSKVIKRLTKPEPPKFVRECHCCAHKRAALLAQLDQKAREKHC